MQLDVPLGKGTATVPSIRVTPDSAISASRRSLASLLIASG
ncbi:hypothetical protein MMEU_3848 [Mycobacterium marinum str. Europe]|nr:hypothetical protein MMEU_3848 [Mycobacterium marinum str. Europe]